MESKYTYKSLAKSSCRQIRVLCLGSGQHADELRGDLEECNMDDPRHESYEAISYVWGGDAQTHHLYTSSGVVDINESLDKALRRLRLPDSRRRLWADAVCINQDDTDEKVVQIQMMGDVYRQASRTLICLSDSVDLPSHLDCTFVTSASSNNVERNTKNFDVMNAAFTQSWFSRAWVVQEYLVSPRYRLRLALEAIVLRYAQTFIAQGHFFRMLHRACVVPLAGTFPAEQGSATRQHPETRFPSWVPDWMAAFLDPFSQTSYVGEAMHSDFQCIPLVSSAWVSDCSIGPDNPSEDRTFYERLKGPEGRWRESKGPLWEPWSRWQRTRDSGLESWVRLKGRNARPSDTLVTHGVLLDLVGLSIDSERWNRFRDSYTALSWAFSFLAIKLRLRAGFRLGRACTPLIFLGLLSTFLRTKRRDDATAHRVLVGLWIAGVVWCTADFLIASIMWILVAFAQIRVMRQCSLGTFRNIFATDPTRLIHGMTWDPDTYIFDKINPLSNGQPGASRWDRGEPHSAKSPWHLEWLLWKGWKDEPYHQDGPWWRRVMRCGFFAAAPSRLS
ncbi:hypothetical protein OQA88_4384 [Cercophora sp. LCS_1]